MGQTTIYLSGCRNRSECAGRYEPAKLLLQPGGFDGVYRQIPQGHGGRDLQHRISSSTRLTANVQTVVGIISLLNYHLLSIEGNRTAASIPGYTALAAKASTVSTMALTRATTLAFSRPSRNGILFAPRGLPLFPLMWTGFRVPDGGSRISGPFFGPVVHTPSYG